MNEFANCVFARNGLRVSIGAPGNRDAVIWSTDRVDGGSLVAGAQVELTWDKKPKAVAIHIDGADFQAANRCVENHIWHDYRPGDWVRLEPEDATVAAALTAKEREPVQIDCLYGDVRGGVRLTGMRDSFYSWNVSELRKVKPPKTVAA